MRPVPVLVLACGLSLGACAGSPHETSGYASANLYIPAWTARAELGRCFAQPHVGDWLHVMRYRALGGGQQVYPVTLCSDAITDARNFAIEIESSRDAAREVPGFPVTSGAGRGGGLAQQVGYAPGSNL